MDPEIVKLFNGMNPKAVEKFLTRYHKSIIGTIEDKATTDSRIHSLRLKVSKKNKSLTLLINVPHDMVIPSVALTKGDQVSLYAVEDETDRKNGYDGSLRALANHNTRKIYEFTGENPKNYLRAIIPSSEVK